MSTPPLLRLEDIRLSFGGPALLDGVELQVGAGERIALVGRNGSGKSTLLQIAAGLVEPQDGTLFRQPTATVRYLPQVPDFAGHASVHDYVLAGLGPADDAHRAAAILDRLGLSPDARPDTLSGGEARRAALARVLAPAPDILLLDEPTNHLDLSTIEWLEDDLSRRNAALVVISHDRRFLERVSNATVWLDRGRTRRLERGFADFEAWRDAVYEEEERAHHKLGREIAREEDWLRYGVTARRKRNMRRLGELQRLRAQHRDREGPQGAAALSAGDVARAGKLVIEAEGIAKRYGETTIVRDFSIRIRRGERIGLIGPNGAGKTTLLTMLTGALAPDGGTVRHGANVEIGMLDQKRAAFDPGETLAHFLTGGRGDTLSVNGAQRHVTGYMKDFLFRPEQARLPVGELSGGERARLALAKLLAGSVNLLVLDEPTNDLDMETLDLLQELVAGFAGTVLLVSHDRDFLDRTVTATIAPAGDGRWTRYAGGYSDLLAQRGTTRFEAPRDAAVPRRSEKPAASPAPARTPRLSYKQKYALETLPARTEAHGGEIAALERDLADPQLYSSDPKRFARTTARLEVLRTELAAMEEEWLALEMLREAIEG